MVPSGSPVMGDVIAAAPTLASISVSSAAKWLASADRS